MFLKTFIFTLFSTYLLAGTPNYSFVDVSVNHLDWTKKTQTQSPQKDFSYLEIEGGIGYDWGDFYMFVDIENPTKGYKDDEPDNLRIAFKPVLDIKLGDSAFYYHIQDYSLVMDTFYTHDIINALAYKYTTQGFWIKPFLGVMYKNSTYYTGFGGYTFGLNLAYDFSLFQENFTLALWHENNFLRNKDDYDKSGYQGALSIWYKLIDEVTLGLQYRYADVNLGYSGYQDGIIYSLKYNF